jgi:riboflavin synthase
MINLERSLKFGDRIHGHLVSGHVDSLAKVEFREDLGDSLILGFRYSPKLQPLVWLKGSITLNGVSLTVNKSQENYLEVCLIPETLKRTNLKALKIGETVTVEPDYMTKSMHQYFENQNNILKYNFEKNNKANGGLS